MSGSVPLPPATRWRIFALGFLLGLILTAIACSTLPGQEPGQEPDAWSHREAHDIPDYPGGGESWFHVLMDIEERAWAARESGEPSEGKYRAVARLCAHSTSRDAGIDGEENPQHRDAVRAAWIAAHGGDWDEVLAQLGSTRTAGEVQRGVARSRRKCSSVVSERSCNSRRRPVSS